MPLKDLSGPLRGSFCIHPLTVNMAPIQDPKETQKAPPPVVPKDLLEHLEKRFPNRVPDIDTPARKVWSAVGQQDVIAHLRALFNRQNKPLEE